MLTIFDTVAATVGLHMAEDEDPEHWSWFTTTLSPFSCQQTIVKEQSVY